MRKLPANPASVIPLMVLESATPATVTAMLDHVPKYGPREWRRLVSNTVGAIHQIPRVLRTRSLPSLDLKDVEAYFGRSSAGVSTPGSNLYGRFQAGLKRGHKYGMVFAEVTISASLRLERFGISLIEQLKEADGLCISNKTLTARGNVGVKEPGYLYLTFTLTEGDEHASILSQEEIDAAVASVLRDVGVAKGAQTKSLYEVAAREGLVLANDVRFVGEHVIALAQ